MSTASSTLVGSADFFDEFRSEQAKLERAELRPLSAALWELLQRPLKAKEQVQRDGAWGYTRARTITRSDFTRHLNNEVTYAVGSVYEKKALFLAWDIDALFQERLAVFAEVFMARGWYSAAFAVSGSTEQRGKLILTLAEAIPQTAGVSLVRAILDGCKRDPRFGPVAAGDVTMFPNSGSAAGNTVRILGRNRSRRDIGTERVLALGGAAPSDAVAFLRGVFPLPLGAVLPGGTASPLSTGHRDSGENSHNACRLDSGETENHPSAPHGVIVGKTAPRPFHEEVQRLIAEPYSGNGETVAADALRLARYAHDLQRDAGEELFGRLCDKMIANSPNMTKGAREQLLRRDFRDRTWRKIIDSPRTGTRTSCIGMWQPLTPDSPDAWLNGYKKPGVAAWKVYDAAVRCALKAGVNYKANLDPHAFPLAYSQLAREAGYGEKANARDALDASESSALMFRLDRGEPRLGGMCSLIMLRGSGETYQEAFDRAIMTTAYQERQRIGSPTKIIANGRICKIMELVAA